MKFMRQYLLSLLLTFAMVSGSYAAADLGNTSVISPTDASNGSGTCPSWLGSAAPSTLDDAGRCLQGAIAREWQARSYTTSSGTAPNFVVAYTVAPAALRSGQTYTFTAHAAAVGSDDVNINTLGAKAIKKVVAGVKTALAANDFYTGDKIAMTYDGTDMVWANYPGSTSAASTTVSGISELATTTEQLTGTDATRAATPDSVAALWEAGADVSDGAAITIGEGGYFNLITSTTAITSFSVTTDKAGRRFSVRFDTARTLTHNATSLILPGGANITTAQGDIAHVRSLGSGNVVVELYTKASVKPGNASSISQAYTEYSIANPIAIDATYTQAHGLAAQPTFYMAYVECLSTEFGYAAGDRIPVSNLFDAVTGSNSGTTMSSDTTNVYIVTGTTSVGFVLDRANQSVNALTPANWRLYLRVFP